MALGFGWFPNEPEPFANSHLAGTAFVNELPIRTTQHGALSWVQAAVLWQTFNAEPGDSPRPWDETRQARGESAQKRGGSGSP